MIIPNLHIDDDSLCVYIVDPLYPYEPYSVIEMDNSEDTIGLFFDLLIMTLEDYSDGYDNGYNDALED